MTIIDFSIVVKLLVIEKQAVELLVFIKQDNVPQSVNW